MKKKIIFAALALAVMGSVIALTTCASGSAPGSASSGASRPGSRDTPSVVKAAFNNLDPVFQKNLKPNADIAVFPVSAFDPNDEEDIYTNLQSCIVNSDRYSLVEKSKVDKLLEEHDFQQSGLVSDETLISFGRLLGADAVILGSVAGKGTKRELALIAVGMENRTTLAVAHEPFPQSALVGSAARAQTAIPKDMGIGNVLLLPVLGGTDGDNLTLGNLIAGLRDINDACNFIDESKNTSLLPANFTGFSAEDNALLYNLGVKHRANFVIHSSVQKFGQRNLAIISRYNVYAKKTDSVYYLEYLDPVEAWIKLPGVINTIMKRNIDSTTWSTTSASADHYLWVRYRDGVDRVEAQRMMNLFISDYMEATGKTIMDRSDDLEDAIAGRQGVERFGRMADGDRPGAAIPQRDWKAYVDAYMKDLREGRSKIGAYYSLNDGVRAVLYDIGVAREEAPKVIIIEASRLETGMRFQLLGAPFDYSLDFTDMRDFVRKVRGMSLSIGSGKLTAGYDLGIAQGVKYNYWKYAGEDSVIPDIVTYTQPLKVKPGVTLRERGPTTVTFYMKTSKSVFSPEILYYYFTEKDFNKATPINPRRRYNQQVLSDLSIDVNNFHDLYGLKPDTQYYIWAASCWGHLVWLQSQPVLFETRTRAEGGY